jgi:tRNA (guanine37-N1)-methyltransferase
MDGKHHELDRSKVEQEFFVQALQVPAKRTGEFMKRLKNHLLNLPRRKNVEPGPVEGSNLLLLSRALENVSGLPLPEMDWVNEQLSRPEVRLASYTVQLTYEHFSVEEVLQKLLPDGMEIPSSFEQAGQVCHLNLRDAQLPYRYVIAQVILDKNKSVKTVVNKTGKIESEFRTFPMEHLAGDPSTVVRLKEHQCWFEFEYRDVYWNSRLQQEHGRLTEALFISPVLERCQHRPVVADCTCGIGPFSVPIVKHAHGIVSHANDLNPASIQWLSRNAELNKLPHVDRVAGVPLHAECFHPPESGSRLVIHEPGDAREFVRGLCDGKHPVTHALFNLPATGIELLDCFRGLDYEAQSLPSPMVCCYTFSDAAIDAVDSTGCVADLLGRLVIALGVPREALTYVDSQERRGLPLPSPQVAEMVRLADTSLPGSTAVAIRLVRNVAPTRHMFCVSFRVPNANTDVVPPSEKRSKLT